MQRIERYGVIALVFLLVTIVAVSLWGERKKTDGWFSFLDRDSKASRVGELIADASEDQVGGEEVARRDLVHPGVPLSATEWNGVEQPAYGGPEQAPSEYNDLRITEQHSVVPPEALPQQPLVLEQQPEPSLTPAPRSAASAREYTIRSGDTLSQIAQRELGTKDRWRELVELNPGLDPKSLHVGTKIRLSGGGASPSKPAPSAAPKVASSKPSAPSPRPASGGRSYTVRSGDTLSRIAQRELGSSRRWRELVELNPGLDPARLLAGTKIRVPGEAARETRVASAAPAPTKAPTATSNSNRSKVR